MWANRAIYALYRVTNGYKSQPARLDIGGIFSKAFQDISNSFPWPSLSMQPELAGFPNNCSNNDEKTTLVDLLNEYILKAVPKSKISPSRKRMKHGRYIPDRIDWHVCEKCGEPKRPHRICTTHMDICAIRKEDWMQMKKQSSGKETVDTPKSQQ